MEEKKINNSTEPVSKETAKKILNQLEKCICKIKTKGGVGTGFFCIIPLGTNETIKVLMTNYHVLNEEDLEKNIKDNKLCLFNDEGIFLVIDLSLKRIIDFYKDYDLTLIELKEEDRIDEYLELDNNLFNDNVDIIYEDKSIYILQHPNGKNACVAYGLLNNICENDIKHNCSTSTGSSGSPILNLENNKVIGIHKKTSINFNYNIGTLLKEPLKNFVEKNKDSYLNEKLKNIIFDNIYNNENNLKLIKKYENIIIGEINIKPDDICKDIQIINSFENVKRLKKWSNREDDLEYENEKEIKENIEIKINGKLIQFSYYYKFEKEGKYEIEYSFKNNLTKTNHMFYFCESLTNLDLSNFNTFNINNIKNMFLGCKSLINLNLSNFNAGKVTDMSCMFDNCNSLINLNLSNFNTQNVTDMSFMFDNCYSLKDLDLSSFNTQNVTDMSYMFYNCKSLININLSNFNTQNVIKMISMFSYCESLKDLKLSNFITKKVKEMNNMFCKCISLTSLDLSKFNIKNVTDMSYMFNDCNSLKFLNLSKFKIKKDICICNIFYKCNSLEKRNLITKDNKILNEFDNK